MIANAHEGLGIFATTGAITARKGALVPVGLLLSDLQHGLDLT
jgi:hypothetical protein